MKPEYLSLISGFIGTLLGAGVSIFSVWLQQRAQDRHNKARLAVDAALKDFESAEKYAEFMANQGAKVHTPELACFILLHTKLFDAISINGEITKENWIAAHKLANEISKASSDYYEQQKQQSTP